MFQRIVQSGIDTLVQHMLEQQTDDGSWRYGFIEYGTTIDAAVIMLLRSLGSEKHQLIASIRDRIISKQQIDGGWRVYTDEPSPNLCATAECYFALLLSGLSPSDTAMIRASEVIKQLGGLSRVDSLLTKFLLAVIGQYPWPKWFPVPLSFMLLPTSSPIHFYQFSGYARVHMAPMLILADRKPNFMPPHISGIQSVIPPTSTEDRLQAGWEGHFDHRMLPIMKQWTKTITNLPGQAQDWALRHAEQFILNRIEPDGTLYSYISSTILMIHALRSIGYAVDHPTITKAVQGLESLLYIDQDNNLATIQNTSSTVWDTSLISYTLQKAGVPSDHPSILQSGHYLIARQHVKSGDWQKQVKNPIPGGWGFSNVNTMNPDIDDTSAVLRAIHGLRHDHVYNHAANRGLQWLLSMQNSDGGWAAFERNNDSRFISWLPLDGVDDAATDPSSADLTGRTLEYLGHTAGLKNHLPYIQRAVKWLYNHQEKNGSWHGRWGICYIYGTWAALTGLAAVGELTNETAILKAKDWLYAVQNDDGGFGESCGSDKNRQYMPLGSSTLSQTAWALDALISISAAPCDKMQRAVRFLLDHLFEKNITSSYPTGAALPGHMYTRYDSYSIIWPLLALANYRNKYLLSNGE
ncbi:sporulenol synthase [Paenibacillus baekrokdamisoli]|uniref:Sporulenol synthase n=1 Tax=Paenibacillus baekrokdamisoli TaxID=1712516 RepID=A0A3G9J7C4_9BACL|nr:prenyltransferase/squalene oxidase repeat-containing protein [Paenibacillus baekrokdamisoli]MBB3067109.1 sporulenol synthase [Paenibacillus baekrokdamisoli]BBH19698.1 sporulenol synthase [Paenibacillus baekrokdamisoli]